jgi:transposase
VRPKQKAAGLWFPFHQENDLPPRNAVIKSGRVAKLKRGSPIPPCLIGMEACVGAHYLRRKLASLGHDAGLMPAKYVRPYSKGQKNDFNDAEARSLRL